eukprot:2484367-Rhodomonas_salina.3
MPGQYQTACRTLAWGGGRRSGLGARRPIALDARAPHQTVRIARPRPVPDSSTGQCRMSVPDIAYTANSRARKRIPGRVCTEDAEGSGAASTRVVGGLATWRYPARYPAR